MKVLENAKYIKIATSLALVGPGRHAGAIHWPSCLDRPLPEGRCLRLDHFFRSHRSCLERLEPLVFWILTQF